jgi:hypothetical protein
MALPNRCHAVASVALSMTALFGITNCISGLNSPSAPEWTKINEFASHTLRSLSTQFSISDFCAHRDFPRQPPRIHTKAPSVKGHFQLSCPETRTGLAARGTPSSEPHITPSQCLTNLQRVEQHQFQKRTVKISHTPPPRKPRSLRKTQRASPLDETRISLKIRSESSSDHRPNRRPAPSSAP